RHGPHRGSGERLAVRARHETRDEIGGHTDLGGGRARRGGGREQRHEEGGRGWRPHHHSSAPSSSIASAHARTGGTRLKRSRRAQRRHSTIKKNGRASATRYRAAARYVR